MARYIVSVWCQSSSSHERTFSNKREAIAACRRSVEEGYEDSEEGCVQDERDEVIARFHNVKGKAERLNP